MNYTMYMYMYSMELSSNAEDPSKKPELLQVEHE